MRHLQLQRCYYDNYNSWGVMSVLSGTQPSSISGHCSLLTYSIRFFYFCLHIKEATIQGCKYITSPRRLLPRPAGQSPLSATCRYRIFLCRVVQPQWTSLYLYARLYHQSPSSSMFCSHHMSSRLPSLPGLLAAGLCSSLHGLIWSAERCTGSKAIYERRFMRTKLDKDHSEWIWLLRKKHSYMYI